MTRKRRKSEVRSRKEPAATSPAARPRDTALGGTATAVLSKRKLWVAASLASGFVAAAVAGFYFLNGSESAWNAREVTAATFVGSETCAACHLAETKLWHGSHHQRAMDHATEKSVLGNFNNAGFDYYGVHSRFFRNDDAKFMVETDGPDGKLATFEVKYTFGVFPLQQYLIEFPDGRIQALSIAWDARPKEQGGQRWFHLYPNEEIKHDDFLHWTKLNQNWNFMCAECHSTGVKKNYDAANDRYDTKWAEISVGCETCHGQGSRHVAWAHDQQSWWPFGKHEDKTEGLAVRFDERSNATWGHDPTTGNPQRNVAPAVLRKEVETCGLCHARRGEFSEAWAPGQWLSDTHAVAELSHGLYYADGQMQDEVYNYGSFKQSRMFAAGVTCSDCHDPHSDKLRASGDGVCLQCHASDKYAAAHSHHEAVKPPVGCASCHMPTRTYMVVDPRHDHSLRVPRPDLSVKLGTPNACNDCHMDKPAQWAASAIETWYGPNRKGFQNYAEAFHAAWNDQADAAKLVAVVAGDHDTPAFARASALTDLAPFLSVANASLAREGLSASDPMVRLGALDMLEGVQPNQIWPLASPLLSDPSRGVRIRTASLLAAVPTASQPTADRERFDRAAAEFIDAQRLNADRPESRSALGSFFAKRGRPVEAEAEYKAALRLSPQFAPAAINLADLYRALGREVEGETVLRTALVASPQDAGLHYALGLNLVRLKRTDEAVAELGRASELDPSQARYGYVYAVALHSAGRGSEAVTALKANLARHPDDRDTLSALISFSRESGDIGSALEFAERLENLAPDEPGLTGLIQELQRQVANQNAR